MHLFAAYTVGYLHLVLCEYLDKCTFLFALRLVDNTLLPMVANFSRKLLKII